LSSSSSSSFFFFFTPLRCGSSAPLVTLLKTCSALFHAPPRDGETSTSESRLVSAPVPTIAQPGASRPSSYARDPIGFCRQNTSDGRVTPTQAASLSRNGRWQTRPPLCDTATCKLESSGSPQIKLYIRQRSTPWSSADQFPRHVPNNLFQSKPSLQGDPAPC
jgi:hypothetical protein